MSDIQPSIGRSFATDSTGRKVTLNSYGYQLFTRILAVADALGVDIENASESVEAERARIDAEVARIDAALVDIEGIDDRVTDLEGNEEINPLPQNFTPIELVHPL